MSEALARVRNDSVHSMPAREPARIARRLRDRVRTLPPRAYVSAALVALLVGIGVNALLLQHERHPAPLFAPSRRQVLPSPSLASAPAPVQADASRERSTPASGPLAPPPARTAATSGAQTRPPDQIGELLRGEPQGGELVLAAQSALARLGYAIKADGAEGAATEQALRDFESAHGLPLTTEITPHLVKQLSAATHAAGR